MRVKVMPERITNLQKKLILTSKSLFVYKIIVICVI